MTWGKHPPRTVQAGRPATGEPAHTPPPADESVDERPAHGWDFDAIDTWEPVVPDTWSRPAGTDVERGEEEWVDAAHGHAEPGVREWAPADRDDEAAWGGAERAGPTAGRAAAAGDETVRTDQPGPDGAEPAGPNPVRMALGLASMAAQRMRGGVPAGDGLVTGIGVMQETANGLRVLGQRLLEPASRAAAGTIRGASMLPFAGAPVRLALRSRERLRAVLAGARVRGQQTLDAGRADAEVLLRRGLAAALQQVEERSREESTSVQDADDDAGGPPAHRTTHDGSRGEGDPTR